MKINVLWSAKDDYVASSMIKCNNAVYVTFSQYTVPIFDPGGVIKPLSVTMLRGEITMIICLKIINLLFGNRVHCWIFRRLRRPCFWSRLNNSSDLSGSNMIHWCSCLHVSSVWSFLAYWKFQRTDKTVFVMYMPLMLKGDWVRKNMC
jgi:hypothetical protein